jgi:hypothetical protein
VGTLCVQVYEEGGKRRGGMRRWHLLPLLAETFNSRSGNHELGGQSFTWPLIWAKERFQGF